MQPNAAAVALAAEPQTTDAAADAADIAPLASGGGEEAVSADAAALSPLPATVPESTISATASPPSVIIDAEDPELQAGPKTDLHSLRARDAALDALAAEVQLTAAKYAAVQETCSCGAELKYSLSAAAAASCVWLRLL